MARELSPALEIAEAAWGDEVLMRESDAKARARAYFKHVQQTRGVRGNWRAVYRHLLSRLPLNSHHIQD